MTLPTTPQEFPTIRFGWKRQLSLSMTAVIAIGLCSCATSPEKTVFADPFLDDAASSHSTTLANSTNDSQPVATQTAMLPADVADPVEAKPSTTTPAAFPSDERLVSNPVANTASPFYESRNPSSGQVQQASATEPSAPPSEFTRSEPRMPVQTAYYEQSHNPDYVIHAAAEAASEFPDEYLLDGGDRDHPIHYDDFNRQGLDTEDTIAEYTDHTGGQHVQKTNRVAIYAPRFGAVQTVSAPQSEYNIDKLASAADTVRGVGLEGKLATASKTQKDRVGGIRVRSRASGLESERTQAGIDQRTSPASHSKLINLFQDLAFVRTGQFDQTEKAQLAYGLQAAAVWSQDQFPIITAKIDAVQEIEASFKVQELVGLEDQQKTKGRLRIIKLADKKTARPGDIITFTIRYDNLGDRELYNVRILDNLTPRLQYVEDSATSDRAGRLVVDDNEEGSLILTFELADPLKGHQGGVATFQAKVR